MNKDKLEVTDAMVEAVMRAFYSIDRTTPAGIAEAHTHAITAAIEASGLVERIAELEARLERSKAFSHLLWQELQANAPEPTEEDFEWARNTALAIASKPFDETNKDQTND